MPGYREERSSIMPMDYEWTNGNGPIDSSSPWVSHAAKKRTHSIFDSPSKSTFATPNQAQLSEPNGQRFLFAQKALPQTPQAQNNKVWSLRTPQSIADSSGGETPTDTPAQDSDAGTPETQLALTMGGLSHGERKSPSKRASFFKNLLGSKSPSKDKSSREKPYSRKAENRVLKRRAHKSRTRGEHDSENESLAKDATVQQAAPAIGFAAKIPGVLAWVEAHPNLPNVLSYYMQFIVNAALGLFFLWIVYVVYSAVMADIEHEAGNKVRDIMHEIAVCSQEYERNGCEPNPVPAVESLCRNWKQCKERDAYKVARASVGARTFAMIFNSFVEEFSYKSMLFTAIILFGSLNLSNWAFSFWREKAQPHPSHHEYPPVPQTPQRYPSGGYMVDNNNWHTPGPYATPYESMHRPMLQHAQTMPALPSTENDTLRSPSKRTVRR
ncbi:hypothetical protein BU23DRAFT_550083 [Bimuria novae-zelandiae CBS 107.79]|uniref:Brl1/Brr6 domain-containing protein n=1 Tax=Bimuria novae-zelandiae CBS 107.79 TaxID=1447943 RepID=A0A6A5VQ26_9PLEO|nr:hypothetical protein BU23DRAFT_550083 [Bimuria novae-zelandiae CBS 107.79]